MICVNNSVIFGAKCHNERWAEEKGAACAILKIFLKYPGRMH